MNVGCPTCGAPVEFRYDDSFVRVCGSCRSAVLRSDRGIETLGRMADLAPIQSPLRLFAEGRFGRMPFLLIGMAQLRHTAGGIWQEWYAKLDGGQWAWISEAQGRYYVTFERPDTPVPPFQSLTPGTQIQIGGRPFTVAEATSGTYASAAGEIPYRLDPRATFWYADLADGQGGFATIDYNDGSEPPTVYAGEQVSLAQLGLAGGEELPTAAAAQPRQGARLACPSCGGSLELRAPDQTLRVACPYCNHLVSVEGGNLAVLKKLAHKAAPRIPLGTTGRFADGNLTVIGYMQRSSLVDGDWYAFDEYLLHAPGVGFRWLVCSDGHWSYVQPVAPGAVELMPVRYDGVAFELFMRADLRVDEVLGEFYWLVEEGERVVAEDYIAPPAMLSCETSRSEQAWSLSTYLKAADLDAAFRRPDLPLPPRIGVAPNQPYPLHGIGVVGALAFGALCLAGIGKCQSAKAELRHSATLTMPPGSFTPPLPPIGTPAGEMPTEPPAELPANITFTEKFRLDGGKNTQISMSAPLVNNWAYIAIDLVNEKTGGMVSFDHNLESYSGVTGGESWSEGSNTGEQIVSAMEAGEYVLRVETLHGDSRAEIPLTIAVRQDVFRFRYWLFAAIALAVPFGIIAIHAHHFKKRRWEHSQLALSHDASTDPQRGWGDISDYDD